MAVVHLGRIARRDRFVRGTTLEPGCLSDVVDRRRRREDEARDYGCARRERSNKSTSDEILARLPAPAVAGRIRFPDANANDLG